MSDDKLDSIFSDNIVHSPWMNLSSMDWSCLKKVGKLEFYKKNVVLYNSNAESNYVYIVESGRVELYIVNSEGYKKVIGICDKDSLFGEFPVFDCKPNFCIARVCSDAYIYKIEKNVFLNTLLDNRELLLSTFKNLTSKIRILYTQVEFLAFRPAASKVALILLSMCKDYGIKTKNGYRLDITFTHNDIANMTGLSRVSVSNTILDFIDMNIITKEGNQYTIVNLDYLENLVE